MIKTILIGYLGKDAEVTTTKNGKKVAKFTIAAQDTYAGEKYTEWYNVECWEKVAEIAGKWFKKGIKLCIIGKEKTDSYEKDGQNKYFRKFILNEFHFLSAGSSGTGENNAKEKNENDVLPF